MPARYAFITGASPNYLPALYAFINSFMEYHPANNIDILIAGYQLPELKTPACVKILNVSDGDPVRQTAIRRFHLALDAAPRYKSICLLDIDTFFTANCTKFFELAAQHWIVTGSNGMLINFDTAYQQKYQVDLRRPAAVYPEVHTTSPIFLDVKNIDWFRHFLEFETAAYFDDFLFLNILGLKLEKHKRMLCLPPYTFTGIHHWILKPETAILEKEGELYSGTEERIYSVHGKWWDAGWRSDQITTMENYLKDWQMGDYSRRRYLNAFDLCYRRFQLFAEANHV